jgi:hypothetical protein
VTAADTTKWGFVTQTRPVFVGLPESIHPNEATKKRPILRGDSFAFALTARGVIFTPWYS